jgi:hypothetical protein
MFNEATVRNLIAAFTVIISLGAGGLKFYTDFEVLQKQVSELQTTVNAIYCRLDPQSFACPYTPAPKH